MKPGIGHEMILASAGTGKTRALVNRYIRLLALGVEPSRIIALTFTRKAAGEFLQRIFLRLSGAVRDETEAAELSRDIGFPEGNAARYRELLQTLIREVGSLQLGTIDSFFGRVVSAFPYELGLVRPHRIMEAFETSVARDRALERLLGEGDEDRADHLLQLYRNFTWGTESKYVFSVFEEQLAACYALYLEARDTGLWGNPERIFTESPWWMGPDPDKAELVEAIRGDLADCSYTAAVHNAFNRILDAFTAWTPGNRLDGATLFDRLLEARTALAGGRVTVKFGRSTIEIADPLAGNLHRLVRAYVGGEVKRRLLTSHSLGAMLREFDGLYESLVRETGSLVFADLPMLLIKGLCEGEAAFGLAELVYRLDGQIDHWLVDEFQDTSRIQWKVLSAFVEEVLQDPGGRRSFFHVGDVKQSIYGWRGGDSRLFDEIFTRYGRGDKGIRKRFLDVSWRSAPPVLECVNALFGDAVRPGLAGAEVAARWQAQWHAHEASPKTATFPGHAAWGLFDPETSHGETCIHLITTVRPLENGLSCAILVRRNADVAAMTESLRAGGIPASMEGTVEIAMDNIAGSWIRAFFHALVRPDEAFPRDYLGLAGFDFNGKEFNKTARAVRTAVCADGYAGAVRLLLSALRRRVAWTPFLQRRGEQLIEAATRFEETGVSSIDSFLRFLEAATVEESTLSSHIQVMTVHKAKGLDFDMVIVAGFGNEPLVSGSHRQLHVERQPDGEIDWILDLPNKDILAQEPRLRAAREVARDRDAFEALCLLYVAMTRARHGLYCLANASPVNRSSTTWQDLFMAGFGVPESPRVDGPIQWQWETGTAGWAERIDRPEPEAVPPVRLTPPASPPSPVRPILHRAASPSEEAHDRVFAKHPLRSPAGRRFGTRMHEFLATLEWIDFGNHAAIEGHVARAPAELREPVRRFLDSPIARDVFGKPSGPCRLWREKPYVLRREGTIARGYIDRAILHLGSDGHPERLEIFDFKTDQLDPGRPVDEQLIERYAVQLERYIEASRILTGLPANRIEAGLVPV